MSGVGEPYSTVNVLGKSVAINDKVIVKTGATASLEGVYPDIIVRNIASGDDDVVGVARKYSGLVTDKS